MAGGTQTTKVIIVLAAILAAIISSLTVPAYSQSFKKGVNPAPSGEGRPKVDDKAYKAALDRVPTPKQPYDPWGVARPSEPAKPGK
jgi:hypothetical protein